MKSVFVGITLFAVIAVSPAWEGTALGRTVSVDFTEGLDAAVKGVRVEKDYWFELSPDWEFPEASNLELRFSHSPLLVRLLSTLTVSINGSPVDSFYLDKGNLKDGVAQVKIPARLLRGGMNVLTLTVKMRTDLDDLCEDVHNPALWTLIDKESRLLVNYREKVIEPDLAEFPGDYSNPDLLYTEAKEKIHAYILIPAAPTPAELDALGALSTLFGQAIGTGKGEFRVVAGGRVDPGDLRDRQIVVLGEAPFLKRFVGGSWGLNVNMASLEAESIGRLQEFQSPYNPHRRLLVVTGRDDAAMKLVADHLKTFGSVGNLTGPVADFDNPPVYNVVPETRSDAAFVVRLKDLKLSDIILRGKFYHSLNFTLPNPFVGKVKDGAFLRLSMSHSELLLPQSSSLLVKVNGEPVKSIRLTRDTAPRNTWDVKIPLQYLGSRYLTVELEVFMDIGDPECYFYHPEMAWFALHSDTLMYLPVDTTQPETLSNYPYMFLAWNRFDHLGVVLAEPLTDGSLSTAFNALSFLGQSLRSPEHVDVLLTTASTISEEARKSLNLILVGPLGSVISDGTWSKALPAELKDRAKAQGGADILNTSGFLSLKDNPFNADRKVLSAVGRSDKEIGYAGPYLYQPGSVEWVRGTLAAVGKDKELRVLMPPAEADLAARFDPAKVSFQKKDGKLVPVMEIPQPVAPPSRYNLAYLVFFLMSAVLVLLVILRLRALAREKREQG
ncbi:MAG: cellulose biosynthesis cyclic di-GMP-binding regulatory protein BcsB [Deltaproteobacteria bacterium]|nr:cellulose biosynthesis cyclic di-GMP-binding regulatory protein BcsB [Deltaproteobacteria bacterium]